MGRGVKIVLALAIALIFPVMIGLFVYLIIPDNKSIAQPKYPEYPSYQDYCYGSNSKSSYQRNGNDNCSELLQQIDKKRRADYDAQLKEYNKLKNSTATNRITLSLGVVIIGFIIASLSGGFSALAVGMAGGSTLLLLVSTGFLASISDNINGLIIGLYLGCFAVLMYLLFRVDSLFPKPEISEIAPQQPNAQKPEDSSVMKQ